jgi:hypothetical protein
MISKDAETLAPPKLHKLNVGFEWRDASKDGLRRLTPAQIDAFNQDGYFVYRGAFTPDEIAAVTKVIDPIEAETDTFIREQKGGRHRLSTTGAITFSAHIVSKSPVLIDFAAHPVIKDICHDLIGDDVRLYWDQSVYKKTQVPQEFPWHQDNGYTFIEPQQYLTLWIPLVDDDEENGRAGQGGRHRGVLLARAPPHRPEPQAGQCPQGLHPAVRAGRGADQAARRPGAHPVRPGAAVQDPRARSLTP